MILMILNPQYSWLGGATHDYHIFMLGLTSPFYYNPPQEWKVGEKKRNPEVKSLFVYDLVIRFNQMRAQT